MGGVQGRSPAKEILAFNPPYTKSTLCTVQSCGSLQLPESANRANLGLAPSLGVARSFLFDQCLAIPALVNVTLWVLLWGRLLLSAAPAGVWRVRHGRRWLCLHRLSGRAFGGVRGRSWAACGGGYSELTGGKG